MSENAAFEPMYSPSRGQTTGSLLPSTTVAAVAGSATASAKFSGNTPGSRRQVQIANQTNGWAYVNFGSLDLGTVVPATVAASLPVAPGSVVVTVDKEVNGASVILATGTTAGSVTFTRGDGF